MSVVYLSSEEKRNGVKENGSIFYHISYLEPVEWQYA